jgi:NADPH-dependent 2,4-dienoyl-CoA reductase/sulfur reductase-like enzyme/nitrite reductase/ring-hydroxylating ferredoxin subunit
MTDDRVARGNPDLTQGVSVDSVPDGAMLAGRVGDEAVLLVRAGEEFFAAGAACTHYGAPLAEGIVVGDTVRCPWHHACFSLRTGEALCAPALDPIARWQVEHRDQAVYVTRKYGVADGASRTSGHIAPRDPPASIVIVGAGAAGNAAAEMLRRSGYEGPVTMVGAEPDLPYDRPNLSKDYLAGTAPEEWIPLRPREFYDEHGIALLSGVRVTAVDPAARRLTLAHGQARDFDRLLIATGADPVRLKVPGAERGHVHYLRSLADCRAIIRAAAGARRAVVIGASFIGLEVGASLRKRGLEVHIVGPEALPLERVVGPELGDMIRALHESHGVVFHLRDTATAIGEHTVTLKGGATLPADLVVIGIGVRPNIDLAERAGLAMDRGVSVNEYLETSAPGIFAVGDIARWPDPHTGKRIRVEHWVVAERQGQVAARNMLAGPDDSLRERFDALPFFWSRHYDTSVRYVGHAERWDEIAIDGDLAARDATLTYRAAGKTLAVATVGRDRASLRAEAAMERGEAAVIDALVPA